MKLIIPFSDEPDWGAEDNLDEKPIDMIISGEIVGLTSGSSYAVLRFEKPTTLPTSKFVESMKWTKSWKINATFSTYDMNNFDTIRSDKSIFYRVVKHDGELPSTNIPSSDGILGKIA
jgi:hypothetical protein